MALSAFHKTYYIVFVEMVGEFLYDAAEVIGLNIQIPVIVNVSLFLFLKHGRPLFTLLVNLLQNTLT